MEDGCVDNLGCPQLPAVNGVDDGARVCNAHAFANTVATTRPACVDQPGVSTVRLCVSFLSVVFKGEGKGEIHTVCVG